MPKVSCSRCDVVFTKVKSQIEKSKSGRHFCSRICSASFNNKGVARNKPVLRNCNLCLGNFENINGHRSRSRCPDCVNGFPTFFEMRRNNLENLTIGEVKNKFRSKEKHPSWKNHYARCLNRSWNKELIRKPCYVCNYELHVELCHIKAISDFDDSATIGEVNDKSNIVQLCRNCHWEYDNGLLKLS